MRILWRIKKWIWPVRDLIVYETYRAPNGEFFNRVTLNGAVFLHGIQTFTNRQDAEAILQQIVRLTRRRHVLMRST